jgi:hypothetical protein
MNSDRDLMQMALDALEKLSNETPTTHVRVGKAKTVDGKEIVALWFDDCSDPLQQAVYINATKPEKLKGFLKQVRDRLAQPEPEPAGFFSVNDYGNWEQNESNHGTPLYTAPPKREWVGLTDEERKLIIHEWRHQEGKAAQLCQAIEAKLKEKNT